MKTPRIYIFFHVFILKIFCIPSCFPENKQEKCFSCSALQFSPGKLYSYDDQEVYRISCIEKKKLSFVQLRKILVGFPSQHVECISVNSSSSLSCKEFFGFINEFDGFYRDIFDAFLNESLILSEYNESIANFYVFGEAKAFSADGKNEGLEFFRRVYAQIHVRPLDCNGLLHEGACLIYSVYKPILLLSKYKQASIFVSNVFTIRNIEFYYSGTSSQTLWLENKIRSQFVFEPIMDLIPLKIPELIIFNTTIVDSTSEFHAVNFITVSVIGGTVNVIDSEIKNWQSQFILIGNFIDSTLNGEQYNDFPLEEIANEMRIFLSNVTFINPILMYSLSLFEISYYQGDFILERLIVFNLTGNFFGSFLTVKNKIAKGLIIMNTTIINSFMLSIFAVNGSETYVSGFFLSGITFSSISPLFTLNNCLKSEFSNLQVKNSMSHPDSVSSEGGESISITGSMPISIRKSVFYDIGPFYIRIARCELFVEETSFEKLIFRDFLIKMLFSNSSFKNCSFTELEGQGVILKQFREDLYVVNSQFSFLKAIVVIDFDELRNNVIINSKIFLLNNPQYFWARNLQFVNQILINNSFSNSSFLRVQSFYRSFSYYPLIVYKDCVFFNMTFSVYGFDFCCLNLLVINVTYRNIIMSKPTTFISNEINGFYAFIDSKFIDVGWSFYSKGGNNQNLLFLWYPAFFQVLNCYFLLMKPLSMRSGFICSVDLSSPISIEYSNFVVNAPSLSTPVKGILLMGIKKVEIKHCLFVNLTGDFISLPFTHINGVVSLLGSLSFLEKKINSNIALFDNVTIRNVISVNGAALAVISYSSLMLVSCYFENGVAVNGLGGLMALVFIQELLVVSSYFAEGVAAKGGAIFLSDIANAKILDSRFLKVEAEDSGGCLYIISSNLAIIRSIFNNSKASSSGSFLFQQEGAVSILDVNFYNGEAMDEGGVLRMNQIESLELVNSYVSEVFAGGEGGIIFGEIKLVYINKLSGIKVESKSEGTIFHIENFFKLEIMNIDIGNISCESSCKRGVLIIETLIPDSIVLFRNIKMSQIRSLKGPLFLINTGTKIEIESVAIYRFIGGMILDVSGSSLIQIAIANFKTHDSVILDPSVFYFKNVLLNASLINLFNTQYKSHVIQIVDCNASFKDLDFRKEGLISASRIVFFIDSSYFFLSNSTFEICQFNSIVVNFYFSNSKVILTEVGMISQTELQAIHALDSNITLTYVTIFLKATEIASSTLFYYESKRYGVLFLENSQFNITVGICLNLVSLEQLVLRNVSFHGNNSNSTEEIRAVFVKTVNTLRIEDCIFEKLQSPKGSALFIDYSKAVKKVKIDIIGCSFKFIISQIGACLYLSSIFDLLLKNNLFENNKAIMAQKSKTGIGGVGLFDCSTSSRPNIERDLHCKIEVNSNIFINNFAERHSTLVFSNSNISFEGNSIIYKNINTTNTTQISGFYYVYPLQLEIIQKGAQVSILELFSGQPEDISIKVIDAFGEILRYDSNSLAKIEIDRTLKNFNSISKSEEGHFSFKNFSIRAPSNSEISSIISLDISSDPILTLKKFEFPLKIIIKSCPSGYIINKDMACNICEKGTYSFGGLQCKKCMPNFDCRKGNEVFPLPGFWRQGKYDLQAVRCIIKEACLGNKLNMSPEELEHGACEEGHEGNLCFRCVSGYGKYKIRSLCKKCEENGPILILKSIIFIVALIVVLLIVTILVLKYKQATVRKRAMYELVFLKVLFRHFQTLSLIAFMEDLSKIPYLTEFLNIQSYFSLINDDFLLLDCFFDQDNNNATLSKTIEVILLPLVLSLICLVLWLILSFVFLIRIKKTEKKLEGSILGKIIRGFLVSFSFGAYFLYPMVLQSAFSLPNCLDFNDGVTFPLKQYLYINPDIECWVDFHKKMILFVFIPTLILWAFCYPIFLIKILRHGGLPYSRRIKVKFDNHSSSNQSSFSINQNTVPSHNIFRFFYKSYREERYFWEIIIFYKKLTLTCLSGIRNQIGFDLKLLFAELVIIVYTGLVIVYKPFLLEKYSKHEFYSGIITILFIFLISIAYEVDKKYLSALGFIIISLNVIFSINLIYDGIRQFFSIKKHKVIIKPKKKKN